MSEYIKEVVDTPKQFVKEGTQFLNRCTKPDRRDLRVRWFAKNHISSKKALRMNHIG
ncbi:5661_t:CDS:2 [Ambispora gerdemannii]|uniref:5661_t:CDS:1 n=1 Tax=Ambispora gerdemannii TaxID=144530 RepID=A0A9N8YNV2_9GLOM|nr:5661_t:CDS:2 [Ambispora gerdemannii]